MKNRILLFTSLVSLTLASAQTAPVEPKQIHTSTTIYFDSNKTELKSEAKKTLDSLAAFLENKNWKLELKGYCDDTGIDRFNQTLSEFRAEAAFNYLRSKKTSGNGKFTFKGFSSADPVADNGTEKGKAMNRRVEIKIQIEETPLPIAEKKTDIIPLAEKETPLPVPKTFDEKSKADDLEIGKVLILKNLNFVGGTSELLKESEPSLKLLLKLMKENPTLEIEIEGHVCCANDMELSVDRALTVVEYLTRNGISEKRLKYAGHGWNYRIASDETEAGRIQNRRVEILILKK